MHGADRIRRMTGPGVPSRMAASILIAACVVLAVGTATALSVPFFERNASGSPTHEDMVIRPQAIYDPVSDQTFIVYQGFRLNPFITAYDHSASEWIGPYQIGTNPLSTGMHGGPALVMRSDGHLVVFYGGHLTPLLHAVSRSPRDISTWALLGPVTVEMTGTSVTTGTVAPTGSTIQPSVVEPTRTPISATYPQPVYEGDGVIALYFRRDDSIPERGDWQVVRSYQGSLKIIMWGQPQMVLGGSVFQDGSLLQPPQPDVPESYWYVNIDYDDVHGTAVGAIRRITTRSQGNDVAVRRGVYYMEQSVGGTWTAVGGAPIDPVRDRSAMRASAVVMPEDESAVVNQVVLRRDASGRPGMIYLIGSHDTRTYEWRFSRWNGTRWIHNTIAETDNFFDAGTFEFLPDGTIEAFLTTGGTPDDQWFDDLRTAFDESMRASRGGDITQWRSIDDGASWTHVRTIIESPGPHARYNNPQIVQGYHGSARMIFSEWNNDSSSFIQKAFLWGQDGFIERRFTPDFHRLAGRNRIETAIEVSRQGFPNGSRTVLIAAAHDFPDAISGVPLAHALRAPILLSQTSTLDPVLASEIARLNPNNVIVLGGEGAISLQVSDALGRLTNSRGVRIGVERIGGRDRYDTSTKIARRLAEIRGAPSTAILASGEAFPDALAAAPYAARRGYPVILTPSRQANAYAMAFFAGSCIDRVITVGGLGAIEATTVAAYETMMEIPPGPRWEGLDRYETARFVAEQSLAAGHTLERFIVATGEDFPDALTGGVLAARYNTVVLTSPPRQWHPAMRRLLQDRAYTPGSSVLDVFLLGGDAAVGPELERELASQLMLLESQPRR